MKPRVAVMFGGKSVEHEVSVISGIQAFLAIDATKYDAIPVYITKGNELYVGDSIGEVESYKDIDALVARSQRVLLMEDAGQAQLVSYPPKRFGKTETTRIDVVLPVVHGTNMEDGAFQGYLKTLGVPFAGCDVMASALGMDKYLSKTVLKQAGIPVLDAEQFGVADYADIDGLVAKVEATLGYPVIVKPVDLGSSVGISVAKSRTELLSAVDDAFLYATRIIVEHAILNLREINCAVLGDDEEAIASECEEPLHTEDILSYEDKYVSNAKGSGSKGMASVSRKILPSSRLTGGKRSGRSPSGRSRLSGATGSRASTSWSTPTPMPSTSTRSTPSRAPWPSTSGSRWASPIPTFSTVWCSSRSRGPASRRT